MTPNGPNGSYTYTYDGLGNLVRRAQTNPYVPGYVVKTSYFDGMLEEQSANCTAPYWTKKYYVAFGRVIADRGGATLTYHLADRLGSYVRGIDSTGALSAQSIYTPYGNGGPSSGDDKRYTGQQQEPSSSLGLYYYKARFYSPVLGTFVSADTVTKDGLNRYAYTKWNPVAYTDPTGRCVQV